MKEYMISISFPEEWTEEFIDLIPSQRNHIDHLLSTGKVLSYSLAADRTMLWVVMLANNENDLLAMVSKFPLIKYMVIDYVELMFHNTSANSFPPLIYN